MIILLAQELSLMRRVMKISKEVLWRTRKSLSPDRKNTLLSQNSLEVLFAHSLYEK